MCVLCACMRACGGGVASVPLLAEVFQGLLGSLAVFHAALRGERSPPPGDEARGGNWFQMKQEVWRGRQREGCLRLREEERETGVRKGAAWIRSEVQCLSPFPLAFTPTLEPLLFGLIYTCPGHALCIQTAPLKRVGYSLSESEPTQTSTGLCSYGPNWGEVRERWELESSAHVSWLRNSIHSKALSTLPENE